MEDSYGELSLRAKRILFLISLAVIIFCVYIVVSAIITVETTGVLRVNTSPTATITISQTNTQTKIIGEPGKAQVRLKPGSYQIVAVTNGKQATKIVSVKKKETTEASLKLSAAPKLPTPNDITFFGTDFLTDRGLTDNQMDTLHLDFFQFKPSASTISIDPQTIKVAPRSYNSTAPFVYDFSVAIDRTTYNAKAVSTGVDSLHLYLYQPQTGRLVYDSYATFADKNVE
jgi:hypothetical protein